MSVATKVGTNHTSFPMLEPQRGCGRHGYWRENDHGSLGTCAPCRSAPLRSWQQGDWPYSLGRGRFSWGLHPGLIPLGFGTDSTTTPSPAFGKTCSGTRSHMCLHHPSRGAIESPPPKKKTRKKIIGAKPSSSEDQIQAPWMSRSNYGAWPPPACRLRVQ